MLKGSAQRQVDNRSLYTVARKGLNIWTIKKKSKLLVSRKPRERDKVQGYLVARNKRTAENGGKRTVVPGETKQEAGSTPPVIFSVKVRNSFKKKIFRHLTRVLVRSESARWYNKALEENLFAHVLFASIPHNGHAFHGFLDGK